MNLLSKIFLTAISGWAVGKDTNVKFRGTKEEIDVIYNAMKATRKFQEELKRPGATVQSVMDKLDVKHMTEAEFERIFALKWPV